MVVTPSMAHLISALQSNYCSIYIFATKLQTPWRQHFTSLFTNMVLNTDPAQNTDPTYDFYFSIVSKDAPHKSCHSNYLKVCHSVALHTFAMLCNYHRYLVLECLEIAYLFAAYKTAFCGWTYPILDISYIWNYIISGLLCLAYFTQGNVLGSFKMLSVSVPHFFLCLEKNLFCFSIYLLMNMRKYMTILLKRLPCN